MNNRCFNTSHVVIYQKRNGKVGKIGTVSIHLMLLFILFEQKRFYSAENVSIHLMLLFIIDSMALIKCPEWFQYISCCYLSERCREKWGFAKVSIHLMLLFIGRPSKAYKRLY